MVALSLTTVLVSAGALVSALPSDVTRQLQARAGTSCKFTDAAAAIKGKASCSTITLSNIAVPAGTTLDLTKLKDGTTVVFEGKTTFGYKEWEGPLISVSGTKITVKGASGHTIDGNGPKWWDGKGGNGGKTKPKFFAAHSLKQSTISYLNVLNTPVQGFSISSATDLTLDHITIDNSAGDVTNGGHNTDAFDVGNSDGVTISNANVKNQDDCLAVNSGTNIHFVGGTCSGGHGLSIGSVGGRSNNVVSGVIIENSKILNSDNGVRIKTVSGATGSVKNVTYKDITLSNIGKYGIVIQQDYENGSPTGKPTTGVPITDLTLSGVTGSVTSKATPVYLLCGKGSCSNWKWTGVKVTGGVKSTKCQNIPSGSGASC
ncbi:glycoside hydrolase family 28 protein [Aaosphaeria arxii CBS 175.79]|uniref:endo-polygalacturonase n=1 Tax=Aaosphaeria arxii CBS 175.79 TaxID=1450172 RepID=A0A6A5Y5W5_9PLEO|nr:glycoside hydrolase family 28 protein [Aaosphaeria arxii CBS 175.79]KAF2020427.1 glycoside hydrolase family 28 protein [Aaosphaeria arxii CBS 175.79]